MSASADDESCQDGERSVISAERKALRSMWQLPSTWRVLLLLSGPLNHSPPSPADFEDALVSPLEHEQTIANMHGRLLGIGAGASCVSKWIVGSGRFARKFPGTFGQILGNVVADAGQSTGKGDADEIGNDGQDFEADESVLVPKVFKSLEEYSKIGAQKRLMFLYAMCEMVICEHDTLLLSGNFGMVVMEELRLEPVGRDATGSSYWYFGDEERLYREPDVKVVRARERRRKEELKREKERIKKENEKLEKQKAETAKRERAERWKPRVSLGRSTRASAAKEKELLDAAKPADPETPAGDVEENEHADENRSGGRSSRRRRQSSPPPELRVSTRKRQPPREVMALGNAASSPPVQKRRRSGADASGGFVDADLRKCEEWELICCGADELRSFIDRFGAVEKIRHAAERVLIERLTGELLPIVAAVEEKKEREAAKQERERVKVEWLAANQKKSSRVSALEKKRREEEEAAAARAAAKAAEEEMQEKRDARILKSIAKLERDILRDISREVRGLRLVESSARSKPARNLSAEPAPSRVSRRRRGLRGSEDPDFSKESTAAVEAAEPGSSGAAVPSPSPVGSGTTACDSDPNSSRRLENGGLHQEVIEKGDVKDVKADEAAGGEVGSAEAVNGRSAGDRSSALPPGEDIAMRDEIVAGSELVEGKSASKSNGGLTAEAPAAKLPCAISEESAPELLTWTVLKEDGLPTRRLHSFVFIHQKNWAQAPLEDVVAPAVDNGCSASADVVGYGVVSPPPSEFDAEPVCLELGYIRECVIEYGMEPRLWVRTDLAWYELKEPATDYASTFKTMRRKYEICVRLSILAQSMRAEQLSFDVVVDLLSQRYYDMKGQKEADIQEEAPFIIEQITELRKPPLLKSGFLKDLRAKQREIARAESARLARETREQQKLAQAKARAEKRAAEKEQLAIERAKQAEEKARQAHERQRKRAESKAIKREGSEGRGTPSAKGSHPAPSGRDCAVSSPSKARYHRPSASVTNPATDAGDIPVVVPSQTAIDEVDGPAVLSADQPSTSETNIMASRISPQVKSPPCPVAVGGLPMADMNSALRPSNEPKQANGVAGSTPVEQKTPNGSHLKAVDSASMT